MAVDPVAEQGGANESKEVNEGTFYGPEDRAVHDRQCIGHRKRCGCDDNEDRNRQRIGEGADGSDFVSDAGLMANDEICKGEGRRQKSERSKLPKERSQAMVIKGVITLLCGVALYASLFMLNKSRRAARGEVKGPSVVKTSRAHLFGVPNSLLGALFYPGVAVAVWTLHGRIAATILLLAILGAAATSVYLAYSLIYITRRECPYCWTSHVVNWCLLALSLWLFLPDILNPGT